MEQNARKSGVAQTSNREKGGRGGTASEKTLKPIQITKETSGCGLWRGMSYRPGTKTNPKKKFARQENRGRGQYQKKPSNGHQETTQILSQTKSKEEA